MPRAVDSRIDDDVNLPGTEDESKDSSSMPQFVTALGAAWLCHRRLQKLAEEGEPVVTP
jgi:hypothetical protein